MSDEKYVVIKAEDLVPTDSDGLYILKKSSILSDAVVIRTQDVFAAGGLSAYGHAIRSYTSRMKSDEPGRLELDLVANYFFDCAQEADDRLARGECKLPD